MQAQQLWTQYSASFNVVWMGLPDFDEEVFASVRPYFRVQSGWCYACDHAIARHTNGVLTHISPNDDPLPELDADHRPWNLYAC